MKYTIVCGINKYESKAKDELEQRVTELLNKGWKLQGGVSVSRSDTSHVEITVMAQALIKEE